MSGWPAPDRTLGQILGRGSSIAATGIIQSIERGRDVAETLRYPRAASQGDVLVDLDSATVSGGTGASAVLGGLEPGLWDLALRVEVLELSGGSSGDIITDWPRYIRTTGPGELEDTRGIPLRASGLGAFRLGPSPVRVEGTTVTVGFEAYTPMDPTAVTVAVVLRGLKRT